MTLHYIDAAFRLPPQEKQALIEGARELEKMPDAISLTSGLARKIFKTPEGTFIFTQQKDGRPLGHGTCKIAARAPAVDGSKVHAVMKMVLDSPEKEGIFDQEVGAWEKCALFNVGLPLYGYTKAETRTGKQKGYMLTEQAETDLFCQIKSRGYFNAEAIRHRAALQITEKVKTMHDADLVHCDIKPENILYLDGKYYMTDFGFTRHVDDKQKLRGTVPYLAPELASHPINQRRLGSKACRITNSLASDAWSLGCVLSALYHPKQLPLLHSSIFNYIKEWDQLLFISSIEQDLIDELIQRHLIAAPPNVQQAIRGLLMVNPEERLSVAEAYELLQQPCHL